MNQSTIYIFMGSIFALVVFILISSAAGSDQTVRRNAEFPTSSPVQSIAQQESDENNVVIVIKPEVLRVYETPRFEIEFSTHSVNLDFEVSQISKIADDKGNEYKNSVWEGSPPGGHHRTGILTFNETLKESSGIQLIMQDDTGIGKRIFKWKI